MRAAKPGGLTTYLAQTIDAYNKNFLILAGQLRSDGLHVYMSNTRFTCSDDGKQKKNSNRPFKATIHEIQLKRYPQLYIALNDDAKQAYPKASEWVELSDHSCQADMGLIYNLQRQ